MIGRLITKNRSELLEFAYRDNTSQFKELLEKDNSVSIHQKNLQLLMIEIYKTKNRLNPSFMIEMCDEKTDTITFMGQRAWTRVSTESTTSCSLAFSKKRLRSKKYFFIYTHNHLQLQQQKTIPRGVS